MKTMKQIAEELGATKQQVYRYIRRHHIKEAHQDNGVMYFDETAETLIKQGFLKVDSEAPGSTSKSTSDRINETLIETLQKQLAIKDKQIEALTEQVGQLTSALTSTTESLKASQVLHAGTMQQLEAPAEKRGFFSWIRKKS